MWPLLLRDWTVLQGVEQMSSLNWSIIHKAALVTSVPIKRPPELVRLSSVRLRPRAASEASAPARSVLRPQYKPAGPNRRRRREDGGPEGKAGRALWFPASPSTLNWDANI